MRVLQKPPLPSGDDSRDGGGRATQDAKAEGWGEGIKKANAFYITPSSPPSPSGRRCKSLLRHPPEGEGVFGRIRTRAALYGSSLFLTSDHERSISKQTNPPCSPAYIGGDGPPRGYLLHTDLVGVPYRDRKSVV